MSDGGCCHGGRDQRSVNRLFCYSSKNRNDLSYLLPDHVSCDVDNCLDKWTRLPNVFLFLRSKPVMEDSGLAHMGGVATSPYRTRSVTAATTAAIFPSQTFEHAHSFSASPDFGIGDPATSHDYYDDMPPLMEAAAGSFAAAGFAAPSAGVASLPMTESSYASSDEDDCDEVPPPRPTIHLRKRKASDALEDNKPQAGLKSDPDEPSDCCICMCEPEKEEAAGVDGCEHVFCFGCIEKWAERENTCPLCKNRFTNIARVCGGSRKKVKTRDQRADMGPGNALESLLAGMASQHAFPPHLARLFLAGFPSTDSAGATARSQRVEIGSRAYRVSTRVTTRSTTTTATPATNAGDEDDDFLVGTRDDEGYRHFAQRVRNMSRHHGLFGAYPVAVSASTASARRGTPMVEIAASLPSRRERVRRDARSRDTRSMVYAAIQRSILSTTRAGGRPENAIEIMDDSDEEIEVLQVNTLPRRSFR